LKFDIIIGNPPYQAPGGTQTGRTIWDKFVARSLELISDGGSLVYINPPRWRQPTDRLERIYKDNQLVFCWMYTVKEGMKTFGACTNYDVYQIQKVPPTQPTRFRYYDGTRGEADASVLPMIPNMNMDWWLKAFADKGPKLEVICTHTHSPDRKHCAREQDDNFRFPFIHKLSGKGVEICYTNREHKYQGQTKIAFRDQGKPWATVTTDGCGSHTYFILGDNPEVISFLNSDQYKRVVESATFSHRQINYKSLRYIPLGMVLPANK